MPKTPKQKLKAKLKRKEKQALKKAVVLKSVENQITGKGKYKIRVPRIKGKGGYFTDLLKNFGGKALRGGISALGNAVIPGIGDMAGDMFTNITGLGKYKLNRNSLAPPEMMNVELGGAVARPPSFSTDGTGSDIVFKHSEYVADVLSSIAFTSTTYYINPGNPILFPWLSQIASLYELYEMDGLIFEFRPTSSTSIATANPGMGVVVIATEYDVYDANFGNKREMDSSEYASSGVPYQCFIHPIECDPKRGVVRSNYVLPGAVDLTGINGDARLDMMGATTIATQGQQAGGAAIGELWVSYRIRLSRPILESNLITSTFTQHVSGTSSVNNATSPVIVTNNTSGGTAFGIVIEGTGNASRLHIDNTNGVTGFYAFSYINLFSSAPTYTAVAAGATAANCNFLQSAGGVGTTDCNGSSFVGTLGTASSNFIVDFSIANTGVVTIPLPDANKTGAWDLYITPYSQFVSAERLRTRQKALEESSSRITILEKQLADVMSTLKSSGLGKGEVEAEKLDDTLPLFPPQLGPRETVQQSFDRQWEERRILANRAEMLPEANSRIVKEVEDDYCAVHNAGGACSCCSGAKVLKIKN